jgi:hypothetical protein
MSAQLVTVLLVCAVIFLAGLKLGSLKFIQTTQYPLGGVQRAFCTSCIDMRFVDESNSFFQARYGDNAYDSYVVPGPALALYSVSGGLFASDFRLAWTRALSISMLVNSSEVVTLLDHEYCGYFRASYTNKTDAELKLIQFSLSSMTANQIKTAFPSVTVEAFWMGLGTGGGEIETVTWQ